MNRTTNSDQGPLLSAEGLVTSYHMNRVVDGVDITVNQGEIVGLLGPNGAGKTTSFYMIIGLIKAEAGKVLFDGVDVTRMPMYKRARLGMGYLSQEPSIFRNMTVRDNILCILETLRLTRQERDERLQHLLDGLGLTPLADHKALTLSGGERRRLEITRAMVTNPSYIMLDEPFSGVDPKAVYDVQNIISQLKELGLSILITDHSVRETLDIVDRAYIMSEGRILCQGNREFLLNDPQAREVYLGPAFTA